MKSYFSLLYIILIFPLFSLSQKQVDKEVNRQFDFWLGKWEVFTNEELVGKNTVVLLQNGNLIQENWVSEKDNFTGTSYSFYNPKTNKWQQIWIDKNGNNLLLKGGFVNNQMILQTDNDSYMGEPNSIHRITWSLMPNGNVKQIWVSSTDKGKSWSVQFEGIYKKLSD